MMSIKIQSSTAGDKTGLGMTVTKMSKSVITKKEGNPLRDYLRWRVCIPDMKDTTVEEE